MVRLLLFMLRMVSPERAAQPQLAGYAGDDWPADRSWAARGYGYGDRWPGEPGGYGAPGEPAGPGWPEEPGQTRLLREGPGRPVPRPPHAAGSGSADWRGAGPPGQGRRRPRIPRWLKWAAVLAVAGLIFRRVIAWAVLVALSAALHLVGVNVHLPAIRFAWPWQTITRGTTTNTDLGPWVLQRIEGISRPALGRVSFDFYFTHKVSKSIGIWPCWYASTFYAVGYASATVDLNPGPAWWAPASGHYRLQVLSRPAAGKPGQVAVTMELPAPQLPQSVHDVTIDNIPSRPIDTQHSWTYPGFGCGLLLRPQFPQSVLYAQAQQIAFYKATHVAQVTRPLVSTTEAEASQTIQNNFVQPTLNALGYTLDRFTLRWAGP